MKGDDDALKCDARNSGKYEALLDSNEMEENGEEGDEFCIECEDQLAEIICVDCSNEQYCRPCWGAIHRRGKRCTHEVKPILGNVVSRIPTELEFRECNTQVGETNNDRMEEEERSSHHLKSSDSSVGNNDMMKRNIVERQHSFKSSLGCDSSSGAMTSLKNLVDNCRYVPMRLSFRSRERKLLSVLMSALNISEYTDHVDVLRRWDKATIALEQLETMLGYVLGLAVAGNVEGGEKLLLAAVKANEKAAKLENTAVSSVTKVDYSSSGGGGSSTVNGRRRKQNVLPSFCHYVSFFQDVFETGRRHKISNPHHMRSDYGKMMFMLQDAQTAVHARTTGDEFSLVKDIEMVTPFLEKRDAIDLLRDPRIVTATSSTDEKERESTRRELIEEYSTDVMSPVDIERVLLRELLTENFDAKSPNPAWSLKISPPSFGSRGGENLLFGGINNFGFSSYRTHFGEMQYAGVRETKGGAKLNHSHSTQFTFVNQSLCLWTEAMKCTYRLWVAADGDLLNGRASYRLLNTGQGLNRVQQCPSVSKEMRNVLMATKGGCEEGWIGLSVVHLGDRDVPNALTFIDKYAQIPGMLSPVVSAVNAVWELNRDHNVKIYVEQVLGGEKAARLHVLTDFFKHAFNGDGDDGGSCIDGRITSCWNWCSKISSKLSAAEDIAKRAKELKADFPLDWTTDSDETRAYIDYVRLFQYVESLEMLLPSLKASFNRADDGSELVPTSGLDGPSLRAYSDQLRELQICRDDLLARRSMNNNNSEAQRQPSIYLSQSDVLSCPTPTGGQASDQSSTNVVARKRRLGVSSSNLQKSKLQPGGGAVMTSEVVAADILDLTGQLKASAGEVNSTLKTQTAILEKTGEEALQNVERVRRETDKVGAQLSKKRRNMFATFSTMAMALASFCVVYLFIIMPFGKKRTFSSHIAPLLFSSRGGDRGGGLGLQTVDHVVPSRDENGEYATTNNSNFPMKDEEDFLDGLSVVGGGEEENDESLRTLLDFNSLVEGDDDSDTCDEERHAEILLQNLTDFESEAGVDGRGIVDSFEKMEEFEENVLHKSDEVVKNIDNMFEATKNLHEPNTVGEESLNLNFGIEVEKYPNEKSDEVVVVEPPDVVEETETETKQNECFTNLGDGPPNMRKEEEANIPNEEGDDEVVTEGPPPHLVVEKGAEILLDSSSTGEGCPGASEEAEEVLKGIDVHLEGTLETNQNSDGPVDDAVSLENAKKFPSVSKDTNKEEVGKIQFQDDAVAEDNDTNNNTEASVSNYANGEAAATVELKNAVEFSNEGNEFEFHEMQQDVIPSTTTEGREKEEIEGVPEEDDNNNMNGNDDEAIKDPIMNKEEDEARNDQAFFKEKFKLERAKLQEAIEKLRAGDEL